jgi:acetyl-CoA carboxylase biotin carboxyl carrier protein
MSKDVELVKEFIKLAKNESVSELRYETDKFKVHLNLNTSTTGTVVQSAPQQVVQAAPQQPVVQPQAVAKAESAKAGAEIKSPFVGTFYTAPAPGKPDYVKVGDKVSKGQTLCILEAMKIMNEIESDVDGTVLEICVENESLVEFGETLYIIG